MEKTIEVRRGSTLRCPHCGTNALSVNRVMVHHPVDSIVVDLDFGALDRGVGIDGGGGEGWVVIGIHCPNCTTERLGPCIYLRTRDGETRIDAGIDAVWLTWDTDFHDDEDMCVA